MIYWNLYFYASYYMYRVNIIMLKSIMDATNTIVLSVYICFFEWRVLFAQFSHASHPFVWSMESPTGITRGKTHLVITLCICRTQCIFKLKFVWGYNSNLKVYSIVAVGCFALCRIKYIFCHKEVLYAQHCYKFFSSIT